MSSLPLLLLLAAVAGAQKDPYSAPTSPQQETIESLYSLVRKANNSINTLQTSGVSLSANQTWTGTNTFSGTLVLPSSSNVQYTGNFLAYDVFVASFDVGSAGIDVDTLTFAASTMTVTLDFMGVVLVTDTEMAIRFNGDTSATDYRANDFFVDTNGSDGFDSNNGSLARCFLGRSTVGGRATYPYSLHAQISVVGNQASMIWQSGYHQTGQTIAYEAHGMCEYFGGATNVTSINVMAITASGKFQGHVELRRIR